MHQVLAEPPLIIRLPDLNPDREPRQGIYSLPHYDCRLLTLAMGSGPSGVKLDFRHETRAAPATLDELGRLVTNVARVVPGGLVVFFPSFSYADQVYARWGHRIPCAAPA